MEGVIERGNRKTRVGKVVSDKMEKTVVVLVETRAPHPLYKKIVKKSKKFNAHDEEGSCAVGDMVKIMETRPISKTKRWRVTEVIKKAE